MPAPLQARAFDRFVERVAAAGVYGTVLRGCVAVTVFPGNARPSLAAGVRRTLERVDHQGEVRDFLTSRRERLTPEQAGVPSYGGKRRVIGLRREEVAMLAGMSTDYYTRMERGNLTGVSNSVLESLARALHLDEAERAHLLDLASAASTSGRAPRAAADRTGRSSARSGIRQGVQRILDTISTPAYVRNGRMDVLAANRLGWALFAGAQPPDAGGPGASGFNLARYLFLDPRSQDLYLEWERVARDVVASLRTEAGRHPYDRGLTDLVGELSTRSEEFRTWWAVHDVKLHSTATKRFHHPVAGELELTGEVLELPGDPGLRLITYTVEPASPSEQALGFLASWSATTQPREPPSQRHDPVPHPGPTSRATPRATWWRAPASAGGSLPGPPSG